MLILWIPLGVALIFLLIRYVYLKVWDRGLSVTLAFGQHAVSEGQEATLKATVANAKWLPLPVLMLRYKLDRGLRMDENANASVSDMLNVVEYFSVLGYEQVVREQKLEATRRGCYHIDVLNLMMPQLISGGDSLIVMPQDTELIVYPRLLETKEMWGICEKIIGDIVSRRRLFEDVFSFRGIRDYTRTDPLSAVNWKASARTGKMMVNLRDYTFGQEVRILLNLEEPDYRYGEDLLENAIRLAATVACRCISDRIPVSMVSNGRIAGMESLRERVGLAQTDSGASRLRAGGSQMGRGEETAGVDNLQIHAGGSQDHIGVIGEALARVDVRGGMESFAEMMRRERERMADSCVTVCLISTGRGDAIVREAEALARQQDGIFWLCPLRKDDEDKAIPGNIAFQRMDF